jgi:hypothetical protein
MTISDAIHTGRITVSDLAGFYLLSQTDRDKLLQAELPPNRTHLSAKDIRRLLQQTNDEHKV